MNNSMRQTCSLKRSEHWGRNVCTAGIHHDHCIDRPLFPLSGRIRHKVVTQNHRLDQPLGV